jgi:DNA-binding transcriptional LysR family regulator
MSGITSSISVIDESPDATGSRGHMQATLEPINNLNLKLIQAFILVAEHQSFRHAAELTLRSQSAVSLQIRQLEEQLGVALFHRTTRRVKLTQEGEALLKSALAALRTIDDCVRDIHERIDLRRGRVAIACSPTIASSRLAPILRAFELDYPHVKIVVREQNPGDLFESVQAGTVDFAIGPVVNNPDLNFEIILEEKLYAIVPANLRVSKEATISVRELASLPLLLLNPASALRALLNAAFEAEGIELTTKYEFSQAQTLLSMAGAGLGVAILPESVLPIEPIRNVSFVPISHRDLVRRVALITRKGHSLSPASMKLAERSRELIG